MDNTLTNFYFKPKKFGIRVDGCELAIESIVKNYLYKSNYSEFKYYEIGVAACQTFQSVYEIIKENIKHENWRCDGLDIAESPQIRYTDFKYPLCIYDKNGCRIYGVTQSPLEKACICIENNPVEFTKKLIDESIDICLIDAMHCHCHVTQDFLSVESKIKKGGLVIFHDFCPASQGTDHQHDGLYIDVRKATKDLGLFDNTRGGWNYEGEVFGSRYWGGEGNGIGIFKKL